MIEITSSWGVVAQRSGTWSGSGTMSVTVQIWARYVERGLNTSKIECFARISSDVAFYGTWCSGGGHYIGCYRNGGWSWDNEGTHSLSGSTLWDMPAGGPQNPEYYYVNCDNGYWEGHLGTFWGYPYFGMTEDNTKFYETVYLPTIATPPSGLSVSNVTRSKDSFTANVSISSWGTSTANAYRELQIWTYSDSGLVEPRRYQPVYGTQYSGLITVTNSSYGSLTIRPNTAYVMGAYASTSHGNTGSQRIDWYTTLPDELQSKSAEPDGVHSIKVNFTTKPDGGKYSKKIQYSLDNSTWVTGATVNSGSSTSGNFVISGLEQSTSYTIYLRVATNAGSTSSGTVTSRTRAACKIIREGSVVNAIPKLIKPNGTVTEVNIERIING